MARVNQSQPSTVIFVPLSLCLQLGNCNQAQQHASHQQPHHSNHQHKPLHTIMKLSQQLLLLSLAVAAHSLTEPQILEHLYHNLNGDSWTTPWDLSSTSICTDYHGIVCKNNRIVEIYLSDNNLQGSITPHLYSLEYLEKVDFSKNGIVNAGWDRIADLPNFSSDNKVAPLKIFDLTSNKIHSLTGISLLKDTLTGLHMTYNNLKEWQDDLFTLKNLQVLALSENGIGGTVDERIGELVGLKEFYCYGNDLTGTLRELLKNVCVLYNLLDRSFNHSISCSFS
jgi:Leucine-rich repeat (LRR) protein